MEEKEKDKKKGNAVSYSGEVDLAKVVHAGIGSAVVVAVKGGTSTSTRPFSYGSILGSTSNTKPNKMAFHFGQDYSLHIYQGASAYLLWKIRYSTTALEKVRSLIGDN